MKDRYKPTTTKVVAIRNPRDDARRAFASQVQSIAFHISLSRAKIEGLQMVRDWGHQKDGDAPDVFDAFALGVGRAVPCLRGLMRYGLIYHDHVSYREAPEGHRFYKLTHAGELMCLLLVEAGLMSAPKSSRKRA